MPNREAVLPRSYRNCLPESASEAIRAPSAMAASCAKLLPTRCTLCLQSTKATMGDGDGDHLRVPEIQQHVCGQRMLFERLVLVLMARIGELDRQGAVRALELLEGERSLPWRCR